MITAQDILSSDGKFPDRARIAPTGVVAAAADLATRLAALFTDYGQPRPRINSGYRTYSANKAAKGAKNSAHLYGMAADFVDSDRKFCKWLTSGTGLDSLVRNGLWIEDPSKTSTWLHIQSRPAVNRIFSP